MLFLNLPGACVSHLVNLPLLPSLLLHLSGVVFFSRLILFSSNSVSEAFVFGRDRHYFYYYYQ